MRNPHFDDERILWRDEYSGEYLPVAYDEQFDDQWGMFLSGELGFKNHTGVETNDEFIDDRISELTGVTDYLLRKEYGDRSDEVAETSGRRARAARRGVGGLLHLEPKFPVDFFQSKRCLDVGCGAGRWTKVMISLGAKVKSIDVGDNAVQSTRRFNDDVEQLSLFDIGSARPDLIGQFDFTICWGVVMCTHNPHEAFMKVASTVKPGGALYIMVYAPTYHANEFVTTSRRVYHTEKRTQEEKRAYLREISKGEEDNMINNLDMLNTFYNWVIDDETILDWCAEAGLSKPTFLNWNEPYKCAHHVLVTRPFQKC